MKNMGMRIALIAMLVNAPRFVITFLAADSMRFPPFVEAALLAITGVATGIVLTGGGAYIAHELIVMRGRIAARIFMGVCWVLLLVFSVAILAPMIAVMLAKSELATVLDTVRLRILWSIACVVAIEILTAGAMVAHAAMQDNEIAIAKPNAKPNAWSVVSTALATRIATQLQPQTTANTMQLSVAEPTQNAIVASAKETYLQRRKAGGSHGELVKELNLNPSTAASWWSRSMQIQGTGD